MGQKDSSIDTGGKVLLGFMHLAMSLAVLKATGSPVFSLVWLLLAFWAVDNNVYETKEVRFWSNNSFVLALGTFVITGHDLIGGGLSFMCVMIFLIIDLCWCLSLKTGATYEFVTDFLSALAKYDKYK